MLGKKERLRTDVLIIGGGTAGCYAALTIGKTSDARIIVAEKAHIKRSGCLAAGVNAINCYILPNRTVQDYVDYATKDAEGIVRDDLLRTMCERVNGTVHELERLGLVILKDDQGNYVARGNRNIKINGENIKPILASAVESLEHCQVINQLVITDYIVKDNRIYGAVGFHKETGTIYEIEATYVICATGGASGIYKPNNPGFSRHKMWYSPFNTGAGYAMGILQGAEMTTLEMRFIALRCKDTIAPTGTIAQGVGAKQINGLGENYESVYGITTSQRVYGTVQEQVEGRGPCYLGTKGISPDQEQDLLKAYLNMAPSQTLRWVERGQGPATENVEIEGTEPYIVGGHTASGYWVDTHRETTITNLFAAGDVAGGAPQKYVTGALAEGEIAGDEIVRRYQDQGEVPSVGNEPWYKEAIDAILKRYVAQQGANDDSTLVRIEEQEQRLQDIMDIYAGGISQAYKYTEESLGIAKSKLQALAKDVEQLQANTLHELSYLYELRDRIVVGRALVAHLEGRKETRWHSFGEHGDYPNCSDDGLVYVNSVYQDGEFQVFQRPLVEKGDTYEHTN
ncbi:adenylyl-sulfate reductase subunit alpha [Veillonella sp. 3310]|jgi:succinate dehydrogenase/fumarate reductase, flavoprotein subunit|uniref:adenylyl-sulfate reductase subunit alpha n=1 Tax=Veillonella sp. 3310 TaxID=2490956 RepID=UPI000FD69C13|nr:adenylyl-sulfate reductase subunit alpha [Veillonella sp. 3310]